MAEVKSVTSPRGAQLLLALAFIWAGMVIGVSGLATPVKFQAPSLTLPVALDVGRITFQMFGRIEWVLAFLLLLSGLAARLSIRSLLWIPIGLIVAIVAAQALWMLPALEDRVAAVIAGAILPPSLDHVVYTAAEAIKLVSLIFIGVWVAMATGRRA